MWCTFASQQLKPKRQLFISYHLFSASCPPLSGMLPGNISPGFYITYLPITANGSSHNEPLLTEGGSIKISVPISIWMKRQINKWPPRSSGNVRIGGKRWATHTFPFNFALLLLLRGCPLTPFLLLFPVCCRGSLHLLGLSPPRTTDALLDNKQSSEDRKMPFSQVSLQLCHYWQWGCDEFALEPNGLNLGRINS